MAKHSKVMLESILVCSNACGRRAVLKSIDAVPVFIGSPHGAFYATVRKESGNDDILNLALSFVHDERRMHENVE